MIDRKISMADLCKTRENLKKAFFYDDFLILQDPATVVTPGIQIIEGLGGLSGWTLHKSTFGRRVAHGAIAVHRDGSGDDT